MNAFDNTIAVMRLCAKPIVFETNNEYAPYAGAGTGFMVKLEPHLFFVTAGHVAKKVPLDRLLVFPNNESDDSVLFSEVFTVANPDPDDSDSADHLVLRVDQEKLMLTEQAWITKHSFDLANISSNWRIAPDDHCFAIFGYPNESRAVDYKGLIVESTQRFLTASYTQPSIACYCHELKIMEFDGLENFNGFSGSPVIFWRRSAIGYVCPSFFGMVLRGTKESGKIHFIDAIVIKNAVEIVQRNLH